MKRLNKQQKSELVALTHKIANAKLDTSKLSPAVEDVMDEIYEFVLPMLTPAERKQKFGYVEALTKFNKLIKANR